MRNEAKDEVRLQLLSPSAVSIIGSLEQINKLFQKDSKFLSFVPTRHQNLFLIGSLPVQIEITIEVLIDTIWIIL
jgi:hypothetical protein